MIYHVKNTVKKPLVSLISGISFSQVPSWYGRTMRDLKMDLLLPLQKDPISPRPLLIWICGGGFYRMDRSVWIPQWISFAEAGYAVASIEYRTIADDIFPAQLIDVKAAIRFLKAHADTFHIDPERIAIMGESAGGTLASLAGVTSEFSEFDQGDYLEQNSSIQAVVDFYGVTDMTLPTVPALSQVITDLFGSNCSKEILEKASVLSHINEKTPPFLILHGDADTIVPISHSERLYQALCKYYPNTPFYILDGADHAEFRFYQEDISEKIMQFLSSVFSY